VTSCIYTGEVWHSRLTPVQHHFSYPVYFYGLDLVELPSLPGLSRLFGYNRRRIAAVHDDDYLDDAPGAIREKLRRFLDPRGLADSLHSVFLVTSARYFNYVFNPVNFYYCRRASGELGCFIAEVNNTFRERHLYILPSPRKTDAGYEAETDKAFHVSPFNDMSGRYHFSISEPAPALDIRVDIERNGQPVFLSGIRGTPVPFTAGALRGTLARHPLSAALTMPRIIGQAAVLYARKKLKVHPKPPPGSEMTIKSPDRR